MRHLIVLISLASTTGCGQFATPPSDDAMRSRFQAERPVFESLVRTIHGSRAVTQRGLTISGAQGVDAAGLEAATTEALKKAFIAQKLAWLRANSGSEGTVVFVTWSADIIGPGHHARGYAWATARPVGEPRAADRASFTEYSPLDGNWYLFEELID
jgi:surface antigen